MVLPRRPRKPYTLRQDQYEARQRGLLAWLEYTGLLGFRVTFDVLGAERGVTKERARQIVQHGQRVMAMLERRP